MALLPDVNMCDAIHGCKTAAVAAFPDIGNAYKHINTQAQLDAIRDTFRQSMNDMSSNTAPGKKRDTGLQYNK